MTRRSWRAGLVAALVPLAFALASAPAVAAPRIWLAAPGTPVADLGGRGWHAVVLDGPQLTITPVTRTRPSDGRTAIATSDAHIADLVDRDFKPDGPALDLPANALFAAQVTDDRKDDPLPWRPGRHASQLGAPERLHAGWSVTVRLGGAPVTVSARGRVRPDGQPLEGSLALYASAAGKAPTVLLPPVPEIGYTRQELLWIGDVNGDGLPDVVVRRERLSSEVDHAVVFGGVVATVSIDPDHPGTGFSSGVAAAEAAESGGASGEGLGDGVGVWRHAADTRPLPPQRFGTAAFTVSDTTWLAATGGGDPSRRPALPARFVDRQLDLSGEKLRFTLDHQPRAEYDPALGSSAPEGSHYVGPVVVRVHFRQRSQVLMQAIDPDGAPFRVQVDQIGGQPAIAIDYQPHYNNQFRITWLWNPALGRFERLFVRHSQGC